jgi:histidyl-tRNA synthetase
VGSSIGLDRLTAALESLGKLPERRGYAVLAVAAGGDEEAGRRQALAEEFRAAGIPCEVVLEGSEGRDDSGKSLIRQFVQAEKRGIPWVVIPAEGGLTLRDVGARQNREGLSVREVIDLVKGRRQAD